MTIRQPRVLIIEDDAPIRHFLGIALAQEQLQADFAAGVQQGLIQAASLRPDLLIVDLGLPDGDGLDLIRQVRTWSGLPIIVLSARTRETEKVAALDAGADDYLEKPFGTAELLARIRAQLRRASAAINDTGTPEVHFGTVRVDLVLREVRREGELVHLTPIEHRLLAAFLQHPGKVLTHRHLLTTVWGPGHVERTHYLRVYMQGLRQKLEADAARPQHFLTETGVGYRFRT